MRVSCIFLFLCIFEACVWVDMNINVAASAIVESSEAAVKLESFTRSYHLFVLFLSSVILLSCNNSTMSQVSGFGVKDGASVVEQPAQVFFLEEKTMMSLTVSCKSWMKRENLIMSLLLLFFPAVEESAC
jgi:hypothetical protein